MNNIPLVTVFGKAFVPKKFRSSLRLYLMKAGYNEVPYNLYGTFFWISTIITYFIWLFYINPMLNSTGIFNILFFTFILWFSLQLGIVGLLMSGYYFYTEQKIWMRTQRMEEVLEDFLHLVSENLKGGLTLEESLWNAVRPEFGVLSTEIQYTAKNVMTGEDVGEALTEFTHKYNSPILTRSLNLVVQGIEGGGKISDIIDRVIASIVETKRLKKEMGTTNLTYVIFVSFIVLVIAPGLFTLSNQFLTILSHFSAGLDVGEGVANMPMNIGKISIDPQLFSNFSVAAVGIISIFASMIISIIRKGTIRAGLKLTPAYFATSMILYWILSQLAEFFVGSLITI